MTIRNKDVYMHNLWDWGILSGCFGDKNVAVSDIDGIMERNGQFLVIEAKSIEKEIPMGQSIMFSAMAAMPQFTVLIVWGEPGHVVRMQRWGVPSYEATNEDFRTAVRDWFTKANAHKSNGKLVPKPARVSNWG